MSEWKEVKLGDLVSIKYGKDHKSLSDGVFPVFGSGGLMRKVDSYIYDKPSLLIPRKGTLNNIIYTEEKFWTVDTMFWTKVDELKTSAKFLYYYLKDFNFNALNVGSAVPSLTVPVLNDIDIKLPSTDKQSDIVGILSSLDAKIETNNKLNEKLEEMAQAIFKSWLDGCDETVQIDDLSLNITDYSKLNKDKVILINSSDVTNGFFDHHNYSDNNKLKGHFKKRFSKGDILYSQVRPRNRHWAYCYFDAEDYIASTQLMVIRNNPEKVSSLLLYQYLISDRVWNEFTLKTETRSGTFPQGNYEDLSKICVPYKKDNEKISKTLEHIYNIIYNRYDENQRLASLRDTLLPRLMSGELIV